MTKQATSTKRHVHKYMLQNIGITKAFWVYQCMWSGCSHYLKAELAEGKDTVCWRCGETCLIPKGRPDGRRVKRPHCYDCTKTYRNRPPATPSSKPVDIRKLASMSIDDLLGDDDLFNPGKKKEH